MRGVLWPQNDDDEDNENIAEMGGVVEIGEWIIWPPHYDDDGMCITVLESEEEAALFWLAKRNPDKYLALLEPPGNHRSCWKDLRKRGLDED